MSSMGSKDIFVNSSRRQVPSVQEKFLRLIESDLKKTKIVDACECFFSSEFNGSSAAALTAGPVEFVDSFHASHASLLSQSSDVNTLHPTIIWSNLSR